MKKTILFLIAIFSTTSLRALSEEGSVPELPNLFTFLYLIFDQSPFVSFLHEWATIIFSIMIATTISLVFYFGTRKKELIPSGLQNFLEWIAENLQSFVVEILGPEGKKYIPLLGTLFIYILTMNLMILIPFMKPPSSNINVTIALALCVFCLVQYLNIKNQGLGGFLYHMAGSPKGFLGWVLVPLFFPIELLTQLTRPFTLALRLFGNVLGEDILIGVFALFGVLILSTATTQVPLGLPLQLPFLFLALLTGLMQALVFTLLSTVYILLSMPHTDHQSVEKKVD